MEPLRDNRRLLDAWRRGEPWALEEVYRAYVDDVVRFLRRGFTFCSGGTPISFAGFHDTDRLQEALQETFLAALGERARAGYDGLQPFRPYLLGIARNVVLMQFRRDSTRLRWFRRLEAKSGSGGERHDDLAAAELAMASVPPPPDRVAEQHELEGVVGEFLAGLDDEQRELVRLHYVERLSQRDTAQTMGLNRNRVRKLLGRVKLALLGTLRRRGIEQSGVVAADAALEEVEP